MNNDLLENTKHMFEYPDTIFKNHYLFGIFTYHPIEIDHCKSSPCQNGDCSSQPGGYTCKCKDGFTGKQCESGEIQYFILLE